MEVRERGVVFNGRTSVACTRQRRRGQLEMKWRAYNVEALGLQTRKMVQMGIEVVVDLGRGYTNVRIGKELHVTFEVRPNFPLWDPTNPHKPYLNLSASPDIWPMSAEFTANVPAELPACRSWADRGRRLGDDCTKSAVLEGFSYVSMIVSHMIADSNINAMR